MRVKQISIYRNLHKPDMFSIKQSGKVIDWQANFLIHGNIGFHVNENGRKKVTKLFKKNVHSWLKADSYEVVNTTSVPKNYIELWYNPYFTQYYYCTQTGKEVVGAQEVLVFENKVFALKPIYNDKLL